MVIVYKLSVGNKGGNLHDDVHSLFHALNRHKLITAVEVQASGKDIGTRQSFERKLRSVRTSANGFHARFDACRLHCRESGVNDVHHRFYPLAHVVVLITEFEGGGSRAIFGVYLLHKVFHLFLAGFKAGAVMVADNIRDRCLFHFAIDAGQVIKALIAFGMFRSLMGGSMAIKRLATRIELIILFLA